MMWNHGCLGFWGTGYGWLDMLLNLVINLAVIVGFVLLIAWFVRRVLPTVGSGGGTGTLLSAKEILQARYARGEITRDQFKKMLADLG